MGNTIMVILVRTIDGNNEVRDRKLTGVVTDVNPPVQTYIEPISHQISRKYNGESDVLTFGDTLIRSIGNATVSNNTSTLIRFTGLNPSGRYFVSCKWNFLNQGAVLTNTLGFLIVGTSILKWCSKDLLIDSRSSFSQPVNTGAFWSKYHSRDYYAQPDVAGVIAVSNGGGARVNSIGGTFDIFLIECGTL